MKIRKTKCSVLFLLIVLVCTSLTIPACAAVKGYPVSSKKTALYSSKKLKTRKTWISSSSELTVISVKSGYVKVKYKKAGKIISGYIKKSALYAGNKSIKKYTTKKIVTYRRPDKKKTYGSIPKGTRIQVRGKKGSYVQVVYPYKTGNRIAWITKKAASKYLVSKKPTGSPVKPKDSDKASGDSGKTEKEREKQIIPDQQTIPDKTTDTTDKQTEPDKTAGDPDKQKDTEKTTTEDFGEDIDTPPSSTIIEESIEEIEIGRPPETPDDSETEDEPVIPIIETTDVSKLATGLVPGYTLTDFSSGLGQDKLGRVTINHNLYGVYIIHAVKDDNYVLDIHGGSLFNEANLELYQRHGANNQKFFITPCKDGYYSIQCVGSDLVLDVDSYTDNVRQNQFQEIVTQKWKFINTGKKDGKGNDIYVIQYKGFGNLKIESGIAGNGSNVVVEEGGDYKNDSNLHWTLERVNDNTSLPVPTGTYMIASADDPSYVLDVYAQVGTTVGNGTNIQLCTRHGGSNQLFYIDKHASLPNEGYTDWNGYVITPVSNPNYSVTINPSDCNVIMWDNDFPIPLSEQIWRIIDDHNGNYIIRSIYNGCCLDNCAGQLRDENNILGYHFHGALNQRWRLIPVDD